MVTLLNCTAIYMSGVWQFLWLRMDTQKTHNVMMRSNYVVNIWTPFEGLWFISWEGLCDHSKNKRVFTLTSFNFCI